MSRYLIVEVQLAFDVSHHLILSHATTHFLSFSITTSILVEIFHIAKTERTATVHVTGELG